MDEEFREYTELRWLRQHHQLAPDQRERLAMVEKESGGFQARMEALVGREESSFPDHDHRCDLMDPATGALIINFTQFLPIAPDRARHIVALVYDIERQIPTTNTSNVNVAPVAVACDRELFPGFLKIFTSDEISRLKQADSTLCTKFVQQFARVVSGVNVEQMCCGLDNALRGFVTPQLIASITNPAIQRSLGNICKMWENNLHNPYRNYFHRSLHGGTENHRASASELARRDPYYFSMGMYQHIRANEKGRAGYDPMQRVVFLPFKDTGYNRIDILRLVHELTHAEQLGRFVASSDRGPDGRAELHAQFLQAYLADEKDHACIPHECEASANELELLMAAVGGGQLEQYNVMHRMGGSTQDDLETVQSLFKLAPAYFGGPGSRRRGDEYPPAFVALIEDRYRRAGLTLYDLSKEGVPVPRGAK